MHTWVASLCFLKGFICSWFCGHFIKNAHTSPCLLFNPSHLDLLVLCSAIPATHWLTWLPWVTPCPPHIPPSAPALRPQKVLCRCWCFYSLKLAVLRDSCRKWKIIDISRVKEEKEHSSQLVISIKTVVICGYEISLELNAVHSSRECRSSWGEEPFTQVNLCMHLKYELLSSMEIWTS